MNISRRTVLRGAGAMIALPLLEAMLPGRTLFTRCASAAARTEMLAPSARMFFVFVPNGVESTAWPGTALNSISPFAGEFTVMRNLCHRNAQALGDGAGDHARSGACFLTGAHPVKTSGGDIQAGISVDQVAAAHLAGSTRMESLELGGEPTMTAGDCDSGYSCAYSANISWRGPHTPSGKEHDPRAAFDRIFATGPAGESSEARASRLALRKSILDGLRDQANALNRGLSQRDRRKLDEYLEGIRSLERRIALLQNDDYGNTSQHAPPADPTDYRQRIELLAQMGVLALRTQQTRVVTLMLANEGSNRAYPDIEVKDGHHEVSHHSNDEAKLRKFAAINAWQGQRLAEILGDLKSPETDSTTLLDSTMLVYGGAINDGNRHDHDDLPIIFAGGRALGVRHAPTRTVAAGTPLCNLYLAMLEKMNVPATRFGDSTGSLALGNWT